MDQKMKSELSQALIAEKNRLANAKTAHIVYKDGRCIDGKVYATFDSEDTNYQYFIFTDGTKTRDGLFVVYAAKYDVINSVLKKTGFEFTESMEDAEVEMIKDIINTSLTKGIIKKTPVCSLKIGGIESVSFD